MTFSEAAAAAAARAVRAVRTERCQRGWWVAPPMAPHPQPLRGQEPQPAGTGEWLSGCPRAVCPPLALLSCLSPSSSFLTYCVPGLGSRLAEDTVLSLSLLRSVVTPRPAEAQGAPELREGPPAWALKAMMACVPDLQEPDSLVGELLLLLMVVMIIVVMMNDGETLVHAVLRIGL